LPFAAGTDFFAGFAGRLLPNEPLNIFPFLVFLSPLPMVYCFIFQSYKSSGTKGIGALLKPVAERHYPNAAGGGSSERTDL
jgi:hypothetical protein